MTHTPETTGWRTVLTPHDRASRQRWAAFFALLLTAIGLGALDSGVRDAVSEDGRGALAAVVLLIVFGMLRRGTRRLTASDHPELDERDRHARDRAFRLAMPLFVLVVLVTVFALPWALDDLDQGAVVDGRRDPFAGLADGWFLDWDAIFGLGTWFALWAVFLPTGVVAWREPDALEDEDAPVPSMAPATRDGILAGGFVAAAALSFLGLVLVGFLVLAVVVAGLSAAARRRGGRATSRPLLTGALAGGLLAVVGVGFALGAGTGVDDGSDVPGPTAGVTSKRLPEGVTRWKSQYETTCLVVKTATGADLDRRAARARMRKLDLLDEELCRF